MDTLIVFALLAAALGLSSSSNKRKAQLIVKQGPQVLLRTSIGKQDRKTFQVRLDSGHTAEIEVAHGKARIKPLPDHICPRHICSDMGWIKPGDNKQILCMPNKLLIYFA